MWEIQVLKIFFRDGMTATIRVFISPPLCLPVEDQGLVDFTMSDESLLSLRVLMGTWRKILKELAVELAPVLSSIDDQSLKQGVLPKIHIALISIFFIHSEYT